MSLDEQAEKLCIRLEYEYQQGGLPQVIGRMLMIRKTLRSLRR